MRKSDFKHPDYYFAKLQGSQQGWAGFFPKAKSDIFFERVKSAVDDFVSLSDQSDLASAVDTLNKACRNPSTALPAILADLKDDVSDLIDHPWNPLPATPRNLRDWSDFAGELESRLVSTDRWKDEGVRRRRVRKLVSQRSPYRPNKAKLDVLVSRIAAAYAGASGKPVTRSRGTSPETPFEQITADIFANLEIDDIANANTFVIRHVKARNCSIPEA